MLGTLGITVLAVCWVIVALAPILRMQGTRSEAHSINTFTVQLRALRRQCNNTTSRPTGRLVITPATYRRRQRTLITLLGLDTLSAITTTIYPWFGGVVLAITIWATITYLFAIARTTQPYRRVIDHREMALERRNATTSHFLAEQNIARVG
ncbi:MAG: hypothetical protein ACYDHP_02590 [Ferrimicrobium sp.]